MENLFEFMKWWVMLVWSVAAVTQIIGALQKPWKEYDWIKLCLGLVSIFWVFYYAQSTIFGGILAAHQVWVRTPLLLTGGLVAAGGIYTLTRRKK